MNAEIKKKWVDALRSGEYQQNTAGYLIHESITYGYSYCCLGVLCQVLDSKRTQGEFNTKGTLPTWATDITGLDDDPILVYGEKGQYISTLNDEVKLSFKQLADLIEDQL